MANYCSVCGRKIGLVDNYKNVKDTNDLVCMICDGLLLDFKNRMWASNDPEEINGIRDEAAAYIRENASNLQNPNVLQQLLDDKYQDRMSYLGATPTAASNTSTASGKTSPVIPNKTINTQEEPSFAVRFFSVIAWVLWIGGFIVSIISANTTQEGYYGTYTSFSFAIFISSLFTYFIYGCLSYCAAELFKKLQTIINLLKKKD